MTIIFLIILLVKFFSEHVLILILFHLFVCPIIYMLDFLCFSLLCYVLFYTSFSCILTTSSPPSISCLSSFLLPCFYPLLLFLLFLSPNCVSSSVFIMTNVPPDSHSFLGFMPLSLSILDFWKLTPNLLSESLLQGSSTF